MICLEIAPECMETVTAQRIQARFVHVADSDLVLKLDSDGLCLVAGEQVLRGDFTRLLPRIKGGKANAELLVRAAKIRGAEGPLRAVDATAGLGEDSFLLAAAGFEVTMFERNSVVCELLQDALTRAMQIPELRSVVSRMELRNADSIPAMGSLDYVPDVILLDPMFPERQKSALVKKKLQMIQRLEDPCADERQLFLAAVDAKPWKLIVKRPPKGPWLADIKPDHSIEGKAVRFDCFVSPFEKRHKF